MPTSSYKLKRFVCSKDPDFALALLIYVRYMSPHIRVDINQITYWLDRCSDTFDYEFYVFGFYQNNQLIGYAQAAYFPNEYLFFIDSIVIEERHRRTNVLFEFTEALTSYFGNAHPEYRYCVTGVAYNPGQQYPSPANRLAVRLLKMLGFSVIDAPYFHPGVMTDHSKTELSCTLLVYLPAASYSLSEDSYLSIIRALYYKYYLRWKSGESGTQAKYEKRLDVLFSKIQVRVKVEGTLREREYLVLVVDENTERAENTIRDLQDEAAIAGIQLQTKLAASLIELPELVRTHPTDAIFVNLKGRINLDEIVGGNPDPFGDNLTILISDSAEHLKRVGRNNMLRERFKFLRTNFDSFDILNAFYEIDNYFLGRPYPFPLVYAKRSVTTFPNEQQKLTAWKDVVETIVKYSVIILLADLQRTGAAGHFKPTVNLKGNLTLGAWLKLLENLLDHFAKDTNVLFIPELYELLVGQDHHYFKLLTEFKEDLRDPFIGHGPTLDEKAYGLLVEQYEESLLQPLYDRYRFLSKYHLVSVEKIKDISQTLTGENLYEYQLRLLMGSEVRFKLILWDSTKVLRPFRVCIRRRDGEVLDLYPFVVFDLCKACMTDRLFLMDNIQKVGIRFLAPGCTHGPLTSMQAKMSLSSSFPEMKV